MGAVALLATAVGERACDNTSTKVGDGGTNLAAALNSESWAKEEQDISDPNFIRKVNNVLEERKGYETEVSIVEGKNTEVADSWTSWIPLVQGYRTEPIPEMPATLAAWQCPTPVQEAIKKMNTTFCPQAQDTQKEKRDSLEIDEEDTGAETAQLATTTSAETAECKPIVEPLCLPDGKHLVNGPRELSIAVIDGFSAPWVSTEAMSSFPPELARDLLVTAYFGPKTGTAGAGETYAFGVNPDLVREQIKKAGPEVKKAMLRMQGKPAEEAKTTVENDTNIKEILEQILDEGLAKVEKTDDGYWVTGTILLSGGNGQWPKETLKEKTALVQKDANGEWKLAQKTYAFERVKEEGAKPEEYQVNIGPRGEIERSTEISVAEVEEIKKAIGAEGSGDYEKKSEIAGSWSGAIRVPSGLMSPGFDTIKENGKWRPVLEAEEQNIKLLNGETLDCFLTKNGKGDYSENATLKTEEGTIILTADSSGKNAWHEEGDPNKATYTYDTKKGMNITK